MVAVVLLVVVGVNVFIGDCKNIACEEVEEFEGFICLVNCCWNCCCCEIKNGLLLFCWGGITSWGVSEGIWVGGDWFEWRKEKLFPFGSR
jgi:hypothetical protein